MRKSLLGSVCVALMMTASTAHAGTSEALLKRLHDKGILSDADYADLMAEEQAEAR